MQFDMLQTSIRASNKPISNDASSQYKNMRTSLSLANVPLSTTKHVRV